MVIDRGFTANGKIWDRMGRVTPPTDFCESQRPHIQTIPAPWLPVGRYEQEIEWYYVISSGKAVALDRNGHYVPAGLKKKFNVAGSTEVLAYTATDVSQGVTDLTTGVAVAAAVTYDQNAVSAALKERGMITAAETAYDFISKPIGVASYNFFQAAGSDHFDPRNLIFNNFRPQALCQVTTDYVITVPLVPAVVTTETMARAISDTIDWSSSRTSGWFNATGLSGLVALASSVAVGDNVVGYVFEKKNLAEDTAQSTIACSVAGLVNKVGSIAKLAAAGDYTINNELGILFVFSSGGTAIPSPFTVSVTITYYHYDAAVGVDDARLSTFMCATGPLEFGDFVTFDANSNLIKATLDIGTAEGFSTGTTVYSGDPVYKNDADAAISLQLEQGIAGWMTGIIGQVIGVEKYPNGGLERVATPMMGQTAVNRQAPGSATGGRTDQLTYANAADRMLIVNLILR